MARRARHTTAHPDWRRRFRQSLMLGLTALAIALAIGILGYRFIVGQEWSLALLNASMILSGMGPIGDISGLGARVFASAYALFSGLVFVGVCGVLLAPWAHLLLHRFHADLDEAA
jgi:ABC-type spermidine/putrescine transport system permease subunit II